MPRWRWAWWRSAKDTAEAQTPDKSKEAESGYKHVKDKGLYCPDCGARIEPHDAHCPECHSILKPW